MGVTTVYRINFSPDAKNVSSCTMIIFQIFLDWYTLQCLSHIWQAFYRQDCRQTHRDCQEIAVSLYISLPPSHHPPKAHASWSLAWKEKNTSKAKQASVLRAFVSFTWLSARCIQSKSTHCNSTSNFSTTAFHLYIYKTPNQYWLPLYTKKQVCFPGSLHSLLGVEPAGLNSSPVHCPQGYKT